MLRLAAPLALTELGWLAMAFTDTVMVGRLPDSATAIGAVSLGSTLFYTVGIFGSGVMLGMDTLVAQAYGAGRLEVVPSHHVELALSGMHSVAHFDGFRIGLSATVQPFRTWARAGQYHGPVS